MKYKPLICTIVVAVLLSIANPYIMDEVYKSNSDTYTRQLKDTDQYEVKRANRIPGLIYLGEGIVLLGMFAYSIRKVL